MSEQKAGKKLFGDFFKRSNKDTSSPDPSKFTHSHPVENGHQDTSQLETDIDEYENEINENNPSYAKILKLLKQQAEKLPTQEDMGIERRKRYVLDLQDELYKIFDKKKFTVSFTGWKKSYMTIPSGNEKQSIDGATEIKIIHSFIIDTPAMQHLDFGEIKIYSNEVNDIKNKKGKLLLWNIFLPVFPEKGPGLNALLSILREEPKLANYFLNKLTLKPEDLIHEIVESGKKEIKALKTAEKEKRGDLKGLEKLQ